MSDIRLDFWRAEGSPAPISTREVDNPPVLWGMLLGLGLTLGLTVLMVGFSGNRRMLPILRDSDEAVRLRQSINSLLRSVKHCPEKRQKAVCRRITHLVKWHSEMIGLPPLRADVAYPERPVWQRNLLKALTRLEEEEEMALSALPRRPKVTPDFFYWPASLSLRRVLPFHYLTRRDVSRTYLDKLNEMRGMIICQLMSAGWRPEGRPPSNALVQRVLSSLGWHLEDLSVIGPTRGGYYFLRNGHHRLAALFSLVYDGVFPESLLDRCVFMKSSLIRIGELVQEARLQGLVVRPVSWAKVLSFHKRLSWWVRRRTPLPRLQLG